MLKLGNKKLGGNIMNNLTVGIESSRKRIGSTRSLFDKDKITANEASDREREDYLKSVDEAKNELDNVQKLFNNALDPDLIEYAIYQEYAIKLRISYLIKKAKEKKIKSEAITSITDGI